MGSLPDVVEDCMGVLQLYSDGSVHRTTDIDFNIPLVPNDSVLFKDYIYDPDLGLSLRVYQPALPKGPPRKFPVLYYIHGGGFCLGSRDWPNCHNCCTRLASGLDAIVLSPDYRLAPEHRLPSAMDDVYGSLRWLRDLGRAERKQAGSGEEWLDGRVDYGRVYLLGDSSGGNIAHHMSVRLGSGPQELDPVRVRGYVLLAPFFGGIERTKSEEGPPEVMLNLEALDRFWRLSLPLGENRDHPISNPFGPSSPALDGLSLGPFLIMAGGRELLRDRVEEYARRLAGMGKDVEYLEYEGEEHGFFTNDPYSEIGGRAMQAMKKFMRDH
ncbi:hypothetical protein MLD38_020283 [Melastoma candidum]|uniref:Uncharacterized protein n=1 Tax=Melastoma candidum TaxID=119954 RepID=A0ACB9QC12_9MYRT|nr:hypothetical protein MLD38_020283 [Melastoma candidum]